MQICRDMKVGEVCNREVVTLGRDASVLDAARLMRERHVGNVVVVAGDGIRKHPVGILTDRDIVVGMVAQRVTDFESIRVDDAIGRDLLSCNKDDDVWAVATTMWTRGIRRMPVVDEVGALYGIVTYDDLVAWMADQFGEFTRIVSRQRRRETQTRSG